MKQGKACLECYRKLASRYESIYTGPYWKLYREITWTNLKKYLPKKGATILDAGGGTGFWARKLAKLGYRVVCGDISKEMLAVGHELAEKERVGRRIEFREVDICAMKAFDSGTFDMAIALGDPVSYCSNPSKAIKELTRVVKRKAPVVISVDGFFYRIERSISAQDFKSISLLEKTGALKLGEHSQYNFRPEELEDLFESDGLRVVDMIGKFVFLNSVPAKKVDKLLMNDRLYRTALRLEKKYNSTRSLIGSSCHIQVTGRKI